MHRGGHMQGYALISVTIPCEYAVNMLLLLMFQHTRVIGKSVTIPALTLLSLFELFR